MESPVAIVTGAGGGIGLATAIELASRGYRLALCGRTAATLRRAGEAVGPSLVIPADISISAQADRVVRGAFSHFGRIDLLVNNAGIAPSLGVEETSDEKWRVTLDTNLSAAFYMARACWPIFRRQNSGLIVNISSLAARDPFPGFAAYGAAKAGLNVLGLSLAREGASIGVRVCTFAPGAVETPLLRSLFTHDQISGEATLPPEAIANLIGRCATGEQSFTSGEVIWVQK